MSVLINSLFNMGIVDKQECLHVAIKFTSDKSDSLDIECFVCDPCICSESIKLSINGIMVLLLPYTSFQSASRSLVINLLSQKEGGECMH